MNRQQRRAEMKRNGMAKPAASQAPDAMFSAGLEHHQAGRLLEAGRRYRQVLAADPDHADSLHMLGMVEQQAGRFDAAIELISQAIQRNDGAAPFYFNLSRAYEQAGRLEEAASAYRKTIALWPDNPDVHVNLGSVLQELGQVEEAAACFRQAIAREPGFAEAHTNLGNALREQGQLDEAVKSGRRAVELAPNFAGAHSNLGVTLGRLGQRDEAMACYRRAIALQPDLAAAHNNLAMALLARGEMAAGWAEYEWRWKTQRMRAGQRAFTQPQWQGDAAVGKTLLIHAEQGFGDTLQFCRYAALAAARGLRVIMEVQKPLARLLKDLPGVELVLGRGEELPPFDLHVPMLSLPLVFRTGLDSIPATSPYLCADAAMVAAWRRRLDAAGSRPLRIGLAWAGSPQLQADRQRSISPEKLAPLFVQTGLSFVSLQKSGPAAPGGFPLLDMTAALDDFSDTAALIANLDLVISVDTAVAHLAAALGKPVWMMNRFDPCWRWLAGRRDSPWYPRLRIYQQTAPDDWGVVVSEIARDLESFAMDRSAPV
jgi:tetratricopeptide (TPR) repeat protein